MGYSYQYVPYYKLKLNYVNVLIYLKIMIINSLQVKRNNMFIK
jgi:hypothetical protein